MDADSPPQSSVEEHSHAHAHSHSHSHSESDSDSHSHSHSDARSQANGYALTPPFAVASAPASTYLAPAAFAEARAPSPASGHLHSSKSAISPAHFTTPVALVATLVLASLSAAPSAAAQDPLEALLFVAPTPLSALLSTATSAAALGAGTLLLCGGYGRLRQHRARADEAGGKFYPKKRGESVSALSVVEKAVAVTVPYFAALEIGAAGTAAVVLGFAAAGMVGAGRCGLRELAAERRGVLAAVGVGAGWDIWMKSGGERGPLPCLIAYLLLVLSLLFLSPPYPLHPASSASSSSKSTPSSFPKLARTPSTLMVSAAFAGTTSAHQSKLSLLAGALLAACPVASWVLAGSAGENALCWWALSAGAGFCAAEFGRGVRELGFGAGVATAVLAAWAAQMDGAVALLGNVAFGGLIWAAMQFDKRSRGHDHHDHHGHDHGHAHGHDHGHSHGHGHAQAPKEVKAPSAITRSLMKSTEGVPLLHSILIERDSRRIFYFMCLNFAFMLVQTSYGFTTGSLGLISDSVHMFFDCLALFVGLCAAVMSKWPPSQRYPYGLSKMDTLAGFANGIFLMLISVEIVWEAVERLQAPTEMSRLVELVIVSALGLAVNLVGIMAFDHAHMHHGHSHSHDTDHGHSHPHDSENMHGIFLHILADTLGSVSVVISTLAIQYTGWTGFDPLASVFIAVLIFVSAIPLVKSAAANLLLAVPANTEYALRETLAGVSGVSGVAGYTVPRFWEVDGRVRGAVHVQAARGADAEAVRGAVEGWLAAGMGGCEVVVVVERWGEGCWCGGGSGGGGGTIAVQR